MNGQGFALKTGSKFFRHSLIECRMNATRQERTRAKTVTGKSASPLGQCYARNLDEDFISRLICSYEHQIEIGKRRSGT